MNWEEKLNKFLETWEYADDTIGVLAMGSYITGQPSSHSDLDVHIILKEDVDYRERGNKVIDGLIIEYFANPPRQIRQYFKEDYEEIMPMSQTQFITGVINSDPTGIIEKLKSEAKAMLDKRYADVETSVSGLEKYGIWDSLDDLQDAYETEREDFDFIYYTYLDRTLSKYMRYIKYPYNKKTILGNITNELVRNKYLLKELPDQAISDLIYKCIVTKEKSERIKYYEELVNRIFDLLGGFNIDGFAYKSAVEC